MGLMMSILVFSIGVLEAISCAEHVRQSYLPLELRKKRRRLFVDVSTGAARHRETRASRDFQPDPHDYLRSLAATLPEDEPECEELVAIFESQNIHSTHAQEPNLLMVSDGFGGRESHEGSEISRVSTPSTVILNTDLESNEPIEEHIPGQEIDKERNHSVISQNKSDFPEEIGNSSINNTPIKITDTITSKGAEQCVQGNAIHNRTDFRIEIEKREDNIDTLNHKFIESDPRNVYSQKLVKDNSSRKFEEDNMREEPSSEIDRGDLISDSATVSEGRTEIEKDALQGVCPSSQVQYPGDKDVGQAGHTIDRATMLAEDQVSERTLITNKNNLNTDDSNSLIEIERPIEPKSKTGESLDPITGQNVQNDHNYEVLTSLEDKCCIPNSNTQNETAGKSIILEVAEKVSNWLGIGSDKSNPNTTRNVPQPEKMTENIPQKQKINYTENIREKYNNIEQTSKQAAGNSSINEPEITNDEYGNSVSSNNIEIVLHSELHSHLTEKHNIENHQNGTISTVTRHEITKNSGLGSHVLSDTLEIQKLQQQGTKIEEMLKTKENIDEVQEKPRFQESVKPETCTAKDETLLKLDEVSTIKGLTDSGILWKEKDTVAESKTGIEVINDEVSTDKEVSGYDKVEVDLKEGILSETKDVVFLPQIETALKFPEGSKIKEVSELQDGILLETEASAITDGTEVGKGKAVLHEEILSNSAIDSSLETSLKLFEGPSIKEVTDNDTEKTSLPEGSLPKINDTVIELKEETTSESAFPSTITDVLKGNNMAGDILSEKHSAIIGQKEETIPTSVIVSSVTRVTEESKEMTTTKEISLKSNDLLIEHKEETISKSGVLSTLAEVTEETKGKAMTEGNLSQSNDTPIKLKAESAFKSIKASANKEVTEKTIQKDPLPEEILLERNDTVIESKDGPPSKSDEVSEIKEGERNTTSQEYILSRTNKTLIESKEEIAPKFCKASAINQRIEEAKGQTAFQDTFMSGINDGSFETSSEYLMKADEIPTIKKLAEELKEKYDLQEGISQEIHHMTTTTDAAINEQDEQETLRTMIKLNISSEDVPKEPLHIERISEKVIFINEKNENIGPNNNEPKGNESRRNSSKLALQDITSELQNTDAMAIKEMLEVKESLKPVAHEFQEGLKHTEGKEDSKDTQITEILVEKDHVPQTTDRLTTIECTTKSSDQTLGQTEQNFKDTDVRHTESTAKGVGKLTKQTVRKMKSIDEDVTVLKASSPSLKPFTPVQDIASPDKAFWLIFSGEYTKAMSKDWHSGHFCCWQCDESLTGQRYVLRDDHPYCIKCYEQVFANTCDECSKVIGIDSKDLSYKDKHWHEACFLCSKCRVSLVDKQFGSKADKIYCGNCYDAQFASRCDGCGQIFRAGTKKMEYKTRQWHEQCFCCCVCKTPIGTKSFIPREQEIYCAGCYEEKFATRCVKCNKIITSGGVTYKNEPWHRECFTCTNCSTSLAGQRFTSRDEKPYCADCFGELFAKRCTACCKPITGIGGTRFISFEDRHWHNDCFICASCRSSLVGRGFITDAEDILCTECAKQKLM